MAQRDTVLRWIDQLSALIAKLLGTGADTDRAKARDELDRATEGLLGALAPAAPQMTVGTAAQMIRDPERLYAYGQLLGLQADLQHAVGDPAGAAYLRARAADFGDEAIRRIDSVPAAWRAWVAAQRASLGTPSP